MGSVYSYGRVSLEEQREGASLDQQREKCQALARIADLNNPLFFSDVISGSTELRARPEGSRMLAMLQKGDSLIVAKLDRIFRNATDALVQADEFKKKGVSLYLIDMGTDPVTNNGTSRMFFGMLALMAEFERDRIRERLADGRRGKKAKGGHIGGSRPFGFSVEGTGRYATLVPIPEEQEAIQRIQTLKGQGVSNRAISERLSEEMGLSVSHESVRKILARHATTRESPTK